MNGKSDWKEEGTLNGKMGMTWAFMRQAVRSP